MSTFLYKSKKTFYCTSMVLFFWYLEPAKTFSSLFFPLFFLISNLPANCLNNFHKSAVLWLFNSKFKPNKYSSTQNQYPWWNFGFKFYLPGFLSDSNLVPSDCAVIQPFIFHSIIQVFILFFTPQFLSLGDAEQFLHVIATIY